VLRAITAALSLVAVLGCSGRSSAPTQPPTRSDAPEAVVKHDTPTESAPPTSAVAVAHAHAWTDVDAMLSDLPAVLSENPEGEALNALAARAREVPGVAKAEIVAGSVPRLSIALEDAVDAAHVASRLGLRDVHVISSDVHQRRWRLVQRTGELSDPHGRRIATEMPIYGEWRLEVEATERPDGPLPGVSSGASPAYPLAKYVTTVQRIAITRTH
jgi:hypothetical protein